MAQVVLKNISKSFSDKPILKNIDLEIKDGEFCVLVGASGCGKSTLLRMISGLEKPDKGKIYIGDNCVNKVEPKDRDIAMVFQSYALYPHLSVKENIALSLKIRHMANCEIERRIARAAEILKLEEYLKRKPKELSGGQRQRVALARAIVRQPKVFLMDEPLSNLDAKLRNQMRSEIKKLHKKLKTTFIYVTHDQTEALTMGDKIVVLNDGEIQQADTPYNIYNNPGNVFVATFMGNNPMNITTGLVEKDYLNYLGNRISLTEIPAKLTPYEQVLVGVRSEKIVCETNPSYNFNEIKFEANINFEENLGSYKNLYLKVNDAVFCCCVEPLTKSAKRYKFSINPRDLYFFDISTKRPIAKTTMNLF